MSFGRQQSWLEALRKAEHQSMSDIPKKRAHLLSCPVGGQSGDFRIIAWIAVK